MRPSKISGRGVCKAAISKAGDVQVNVFISPTPETLRMRSGASMNSSKAHNMVDVYHCRQSVVAVYVCSKLLGMYGDLLLSFIMHKSRLRSWQVKVSQDSLADTVSARLASGSGCETMPKTVCQQISISQAVRKTCYKAVNLSMK